MASSLGRKHTGPKDLGKEDKIILPKSWFGTILPRNLEVTNIIEQNALTLLGP